MNSPDREVSESAETKGTTISPTTASLMTQLNLAMDQNQRDKAVRIMAKIVRRAKRQHGQPFSSWRWKTICAMFELDPSKPFEQQKPSFNSDDYTAASDLRKDVKKELRRMIGVLGDLAGGLEPKRNFFVERVLEIVIDYMHRHDQAARPLRLAIEDTVNGSYAWERIEFLVMLQNWIVMVIESKKDNMQQGMAQLLAELEASRESAENEDRVLFGIVTTAGLWRPIMSPKSRVFVAFPELHLDNTNPTSQQIKALICFLHFAMRTGVHGEANSETKTDEGETDSTDNSTTRKRKLSELYKDGEC